MKLNRQNLSFFRAEPFLFLLILIAPPAFLKAPLCLASAESLQTGLELIAKLPIQNGGRTKPLDSFARDSILFLTESRKLPENLRPEKFRGSDYESITVLLDWLDDGETWSHREFIAFNHIEAKKQLGLPEKRKYFSPIEIARAPQLHDVMRGISEKQKANLKLSSTETAINRLVSQLELFQAIATGIAFQILPTNEGWKSLTDPQSNETGIAPLMGAVLQALKNQDADKLDKAAQELVGRQALLYLNVLKNGDGTSARADSGSEHLTVLAQKMNQEVRFNRLRPFQKAWILYFLALMLFLIGFKKLSWAPWTFLTLGFFIHCYGFVERCLLTGHPPVTNMYESTIWVPWGVVLFSFMISFLYRKNPRVNIIPTAATAVAVISLILADNVPAVLDPTIKPLEPVLRSNYWLTIHVLTITLSYAAFALSLGIGNVILFLFLKKKSPTETIQLYSQFMYRAIQFGVVLLAAGTILGGIWADYSWGRFWGWDPKETWALIALLMYLGILHGKWAGWLGRFGVVIGSVLCFLGVLMAWYGVNFVLGVGLHSYGFSTGGLSAVLAFVLLQLLYVAVVALRHKQLH